MMTEDSATDDVPEAEPAGEAPRATESETSPDRVDGPGRRFSIVGPEERAVDPRSVPHARVVGFATIAPASLVPLVGITLGWGLGGIPGVVYVPLLAGWALLLVAALVWAYRWPDLYHRHLRYRVDEAGLRIRRGVLWRKVISIPTSRVQHTDVSQGPLQRRYEIASLTVYTAGTEGASIELSGLEQTVARRLRDHLLPEHLDDDDA